MRPFFVTAKTRYAALLCAAYALVCGTPVHAQETPTASATATATTALETAAPMPTAVVPAPIAAEKKTLTTLEAVRKAYDLLHARLAERLKTETQPFAIDLSKPVRVTLAVWNKETGEISLYDGKKYGTDLTMTTPGAPSIRVTVSGKLYSQYEVSPRSAGTVLGIIYPVATTKRTTVTKNGKKRTVSTSTALDTVYIPYSSDYYTPEILGAGSDYLSFLIQEAYDELRAKGIRSKSYPDKLLSDAIDPYLVKTIAVIEQSDHKTLLGDVEPERAVGRFLVKLATNRENAFSGAISSAGAAGMVQFIPSTYALMVRKRPDLGLIPDFRTGMADHKNAVMAQVAYLDEELATMPASVRALYPAEKLKVGAFMAAAYNGGSPRVRKALAAYGDDAWDQLHRLKRGTLAATSLRSETVTYVKKLRKTYGMFEAGYFATPQAPSGALPTTDAIAARDAATDAPRQVAIIDPSTTICFSEGSCTAIR